MLRAHERTGQLWCTQTFGRAHKDSHLPFHERASVRRSVRTRPRTCVRHNEATYVHTDARFLTRVHVRAQQRTGARAFAHPHI